MKMSSNSFGLKNASFHEFAFSHLDGLEGQKMALLPASRP